MILSLLRWLFSSSGSGYSFQKAMSKEPEILYARDNTLNSDQAAIVAEQRTADAIDTDVMSTTQRLSQERITTLNTPDISKILDNYISGIAEIEKMQQKLQKDIVEDEKINAMNAQEIRQCRTGIFSARDSFAHVVTTIINVELRNDLNVYLAQAKACLDEYDQLVASWIAHTEKKKQLTNELNALVEKMKQAHTSMRSALSSGDRNAFSKWAAASHAYHQAFKKIDQQFEDLLNNGRRLRQEEERLNKTWTPLVDSIQPRMQLELAA